MSYDNQAYGLGKDDGGPNDRNSNKAVGLAPVIVTSPAPDAYKAGDVSNKLKGGQMSDSASSGSGGSRRGSASIGGEVCGKTKRFGLEIIIGSISAALSSPDLVAPYKVSL